MLADGFDGDGDLDSITLVFNTTISALLGGRTRFSPYEECTTIQQSGSI